MRAVPAIVILAVFVAVSLFVAENPGSVSILWQGWRVDTSLAILVLAVVALTLVVGIVFRLLRAIVFGPRALVRARRERRRRRGYRALTQGMVAVAAGDAEEAQRFARRADVLLAEPPLTLLLSAQAAQLNGDEHAARKYFTAMLKRPETEFLGLRGLLNLAMRDRDEAAALRLVERAHELRPRTPWVLTSLFELQTRKGRWAAAQGTLAEAVKRRAIEAAPGRQHRAAVLYERSVTAEADGLPRDALIYAEEAQAAAPDFAPVVCRYATLLHRDGRTKKAAKAIERSWRQAPHPQLATCYADLYRNEQPLERLKRIERLASLRPDHPESHVALATASLAAQLWGEARRHLELAVGSGEPTARICRLMAEIAEAEHQDGAAARDWLARAATAPADPVWLCKTCSTEHAVWTSLCPSCRSFDSFAWETPSRAAVAVPMIGVVGSTAAIAAAAHEEAQPSQQRAPAGTIETTAAAAGDKPSTMAAMPSAETAAAES
ncbi:MAG TPA: heme biosynthesis HemY N-terminal domain-containing protein [Stellaceae bacterium]